MRLMLTLTAVAVFPLGCVSYVVVRAASGSVSSQIQSDLQGAALAAQARLAELLARREASVLAAASSARLQRAIHRHETRALATFARREQAVVETGGRRFGRPLERPLTARIRLVGGHRAVGSIVVQLPLDAATLAEAAASAPRTCGSPSPASRPCDEPARRPR